MPAVRPCDVTHRHQRPWLMRRGASRARPTMVATSASVRSEAVTCGVHSDTGLPLFRVQMTPLRSVADDAARCQDQLPMRASHQPNSHGSRPTFAEAGSVLAEMGPNSVVPQFWTSWTKISHFCPELTKAGPNPIDVGPSSASLDQELPVVCQNWSGIFSAVFSKNCDLTERTTTPLFALGVRTGHIPLELGTRTRHATVLG